MVAARGRGGYCRKTHVRAVRALKIMIRAVCEFSRTQSTTRNIKISHQHPFLPGFMNNAG
jgi:hypothetical protein